MGQYLPIVAAVLPSLAGAAGSFMEYKGQRKAEKYLREAEALPRHYRDRALTELGNVYGLEGDDSAQQQMIERAIQSPLYQAIMSGREEGEQAMMGQASRTGQLRSGNLRTSMERFNTQLQNKALLEAYNQQMSGLQSMAKAPMTMTPQIAQYQAKQGETLGQGVIGAAQSAGTAMDLYSLKKKQQASSDTPVDKTSYGIFSDRRLKKNIKKVFKYKGWNIYRWTWNNIAEDLGLSGKSIGVLADEVYSKIPEAVIIKNSFMWVRYNKIGIL